MVPSEPRCPSWPGLPAPFQVLADTLLTSLGAGVAGLPCPHPDEQCWQRPLLIWCPHISALSPWHQGNYLGPDHRAARGFLFLAKLSLHPWETRVQPAVTQNLQCSADPS